jgi:hypothetical protein
LYYTTAGPKLKSEEEPAMYPWRTWMERIGVRRRSRTEIGVATAPVLARWLAEGRPVQILDIRGRKAFREGHLPGARHLPLDRLEQQLPTVDRGCATVVY